MIHTSHDSHTSPQASLTMSLIHMPHDALTLRMRHEHPIVVLDTPICHPGEALPVM